VARQTLRAWLIVALALLAVAVVCGVYVLRLILSDHLIFRENGLAYAIIARSGTVRDFPRFNGDGRADEFTYAAMDGTAPGEIVMRYASNHAIADLEQMHRLHCNRHGFRQVPRDDHIMPSRLACDAPDYRIEIDLQQHGDMVSVTVTLVQQ